MTKRVLKKKAFITPEKPSTEETCWGKIKKEKTKANAKERKFKLRP